MIKFRYLQKLLIPILLATLILPGCATIFKGSSEEVSVNSTPPAEIYIDGVYRGDTPAKIKLESKEDYTVEFRKEGYETKTVYIGNHVGAGWIVLDVIFGLVPVVVDAATGAWYQLDQTTVNTVLSEQQGDITN